MADRNKVNANTPKKVHQERIGNEKRRAKVPLRKDDGRGSTVAVQGPNTQDKPSSSKKLRSAKAKKRDVSDPVQDTSDDCVQDQIIIAPEIMALVLEQLDLRSLKQVRLVCRSWLREAQTIMERKSIVCLSSTRDCSARIKAFQEIRQKKLLRGHSQPFQSLSMGSEWKMGRNQKLLQQVRSLCPPLVITRFFPEEIPMKLVLPIMIHCSSSLECLELSVRSCEPGPVPALDQKQTFPNLRHLNADCYTPVSTDSHKILFPVIVAWIVKASHQLETYESESSDDGLGSELMLKVDIKNVKKLILTYHKFSIQASEHFLSIPFSRLEHLKLMVIQSEVSHHWIHHALVATLRKSAETLKILDLTEFETYLDEDLFEAFKFPVCPNLQELTLNSNRHWDYLVSNNFPSLRVLNVHWVGWNLMEDSWTDLPPFLSVKTLRAGCCLDWLGTDHEAEGAMRFLVKFPELERVRIDYDLLLGCHELINTGAERYSNILKRVKHLELGERTLNWYGFLEEEDTNFGSSFRSVRPLPGIETITMVSSNKDILSIPFPEMLGLKVILFPWGDCLDLEKLVEMANTVERVIVTNCCSVPRVLGEQSKDLLNTFFDSAPNVECGCGKDWKKML